MMYMMKLYDSFQSIAKVVMLKPIGRSMGNTGRFILLACKQMAPHHSHRLAYMSRRKRTLSVLEIMIRQMWNGNWVVFR